MGEGPDRAASVENVVTWRGRVRAARPEIDHLHEHLLRTGRTHLDEWILGRSRVPSRDDDVRRGRHQVRRHVGVESSLYRCVCATRLAPGDAWPGGGGHAALRLKSRISVVAAPGPVSYTHLRAHETV